MNGVPFQEKKFSLSLFLLLLILAALAGALVVSTSIRKTLQTTASSQAACGATNPLGGSGEFDLGDLSAVWMGKTLPGLSEKLAVSQEAELLAHSQVLGESTEEKWIEVDLTNQTIRAHQGDSIVYEFPISSGKFAPTPTGEYRIWYKVKYTKMSGGKPGTGTYYYLTNVPYVMYFYQGFGLHGTYWHNNFGHPMSHGCVNLSISNSEKLFYWTSPILPEGKNSTMASKDNPGTRVVVHGRAPRS